MVKICLLLFLGFGVRAGGAGLHVGFVPQPGRGLAEKKVQWLWSVLPVVVKACRIQPSCAMAAADSEVLERMISNLVRYSPGSLEFLSERENPGRFAADGPHRVAVTGTSPDKIYLNSDLISAMELRDLLAILGHEIAHHAGLVDDPERRPDQIGARLGRYFESHSVTSTLEEFGHSEIQAVYFGVDVPTSTDYFRLFPLENPQDARVALMDAGELYDLASFDGTHISHCYRLESPAFVNQQVSDPFVRMSRWFKGDRSVWANFNVRVRNVCLKRDRLPDADMVGFNMVGHMAVQLDLERPDSAHWSDGPLKIRASSLRAISRAVAPEESTDATSLVRFDRALSQPASVRAGQTLKIEVLLKPLAAVSPTGCGAPIRSEVWHSVDLIGLTPPQMFDRCRLSARPDGSYLATLENDFPEDSFPGFYYVDMIALQVPADRGGMAIAKPSVPLRFEVQSSTAPAPLRIISYGFVGVSDHKLTAEREYVFEVRIENARDIFDGLVSGQAATDDGFKSDFSGNFLAAQDFFPALVGYRREGSVLVASYRFKAPRSLYGGRVRSFSIFTLQFTTANFGEAYLDLRDTPEVYTVD